MKLNFIIIKIFVSVIYNDVDWVENKINQKFITDMLIKLTDDSIHWWFVKQMSIILFMCEIEYVVVFESIKKMINIKIIFIELRVLLKNFIFSFFINNQDVIVFVKNKKLTWNIRYIEIRYHHIQNFVENDQIDIFYVFNKNYRTITNSLNR